MPQERSCTPRRRSRCVAAAAGYDGGMDEPQTPELVAVILAGGAGTRFWPLSTPSRPKQFLRLLGEKSLLRMTYERVAPLVPPERTWVLTSEAFAPLVREQLPEVPPLQVVAEPMRRDTAAAVALAALLCRLRHGDAVTAVLPSDHWIEPAAAFRDALLSAARAAEGGALYTFGIPPTRPATGYGYLEKGERLREDAGIAHFRLLRFREKPDAATARSFVESGRFLWNGGMFVWRPSAVLAELERQLPETLRLLEPAVARFGSPGWPEALRRAFEPLRPVSIDFGVMEHAADVRCAAATFAWSDVGGWLALEERLACDDAGNAARGRLETLDARGNLVFCEDPSEQVALVGVSGLVVVRAGSRTLVVPRERAEEVKALVRRMEEAR